MKKTLALGNDAAERIASSAKFKVQPSKVESAPEISQETWNLEHGTLNLIELPAAS